MQLSSHISPHDLRIRKCLKIEILHKGNSLVWVFSNLTSRRFLRLCYLFFQFLVTGTSSSSARVNLKNLEDVNGKFECCSETYRVLLDCPRTTAGTLFRENRIDVFICFRHGLTILLNPCYYLFLDFFFR